MNILLFGAAIFLSQAAAHAENLVANSKLFEVGKVEGTPLFTQETRWEDQKDGSVKTTAAIKDDKGKTVMTETAHFKGTEILAQKTEQLQIQEGYELVREGKDVIFRTYDLKDGERKLTEEKRQEFTPNFIMGPTTQPFLQKHWEELKSGKTVAADFGVFEVSRSVSFDLSWDATKDKVATIKMRPSSSLISVFVSPIFMYYDEGGKRMLRFKGRTPLKRVVMGNKKTFDSEITYSYEAAKP